MAIREILEVPDPRLKTVSEPVKPEEFNDELKQLADDMLDVTSDAATLGKAAGKDAGRGKGTLVSLHGVDEVRKRLDALVAEAALVLEPFGEEAETLRQAARFIANRQN